ncbi:hypothetical protein COCCADRAFT_93469, partial [Bipolaris zeicola 26-R-13]
RLCECFIVVFMKIVISWPNAPPVVATYQVKPPRWVSCPIETAYKNKGIKLISPFRLKMQETQKHAGMPCKQHFPKWVPATNRLDLGKSDTRMVQTYRLGN